MFIDLRLRDCQCSASQFTALENLHKLAALDLYSTNIVDDVLMRILRANQNLKHLNIGMKAIKLKIDVKSNCL